jgi:Cu/Ag efflux protein CusF
MRQIPHLFKSVLLVCGLALAAGEAYSSEACCSITSVNAKSGLVNARALDGSRTFQFTVKDKSALSQLRVGQPVYGDFGTHQVSINQYGGQPCCQMKAVKTLKTSPAAVGKARPDSIDPCCGITSVNAKSGLVNARALDGSRTFQFTVKDKSALSQLRAGQPVYADFGTNKVSVNGAEVCCNIKALKTVKIKTPAANPAK